MGGLYIFNNEENKISLKSVIKFSLVAFLDQLFFKKNQLLEPNDLWRLRQVLKCSSEQEP